MSNRENFKFESKVRSAFAFLIDLGFVEKMALPTIVVYANKGIEVDIYHGRQSYEVGAGITINNKRYAVSEIVTARDSEVGKACRNAIIVSPSGMNGALSDLSDLISIYCREALEGDKELIHLLSEQREKWGHDLELDVLAEQIRPKAERAFSQKDYSLAAELYSQIKERLSPADRKKMLYAEKHRGV